MSPARLRVLADLRLPIPFAVLCLASFLVARWLGIGLHEVVGHGLFAIVSGGVFYGVYVSPVTGFALVHLPVGTNQVSEVLVVLAGILVEVFVGLVVLWAYPRIHSFVGRLFVLTFLEVLLVYSFAYLALGAFPAAGGDPARVVSIVRAPHLGFALLTVGVLWSVTIGYVISTEVLRLVGPPPSLAHQLAFAILFWSVPLPVAAIPNAILLFLAPVSFVAYLLLLLLVLASLVIAGRQVSRNPQALPPLDCPSGRRAPLAIATLLVLPVWFASGVSSEFAERVLLSEPPLGAERDLGNPQAINAKVILTESEDVVIEFRMKGVPALRSPLERQAWTTFEDRADFTLWAPAAVLYANVMMGATRWHVFGTRIDTASTVWFDGGERPNPRLVSLELSRPEDERFFLNTTHSGNRTFLTLTVLEPFRHLPVECPGCFLDELNLTWPSVGPNGAYVLVEASAEGGNPGVRRGPQFARFRSNVFEDAPTRWRLVLERV